MQGGFYVGSIFGIKIYINWSWLIIFFLITFNLSAGVFPSLHPNWSPFLSWVIGISASLLFFASVLLHELAHSVVANLRGLPVNKVVLFLFGGVSNIKKEPESPGTEFLMAIVGPLTSVVLGFIFLFLGNASIQKVSDLILTPEEALSSLDPLSTLLVWLGPINILVGIFNLIPGFPLDGGRILRSIVWKITDNFKSSTQFASIIGQTVAWVFMFMGISMIVGIEVPFFGSGIIGGTWIFFIGLFLNSAAEQSLRQAIAENVIPKPKQSSYAGFVKFLPYKIKIRGQDMKQKDFGRGRWNFFERDNFRERSWLWVAGLLGLILIFLAVGITSNRPESTFEKVAENPKEFIGENVTVTAEVSDLIGSRAFTLNNPGLIGDDVLVITKGPIEAVGGSGFENFLFSENDRVSVQGQVRKFNIREVEKELGVDLVDDKFSMWEGKPVIIADAVDEQR